MQQPPTQGTGGPGSELRADAQQLTSKAAERFHSEVDSRKGAAADQANAVSDAIQSAAAQFDECTPDWVKSAFQQGAEQIRRFAETLEQRDSRQILDEVQSFARERPALFLGACAASGFAAARILKAGGEQQHSREFRTTSDWHQPEHADTGGQNFEGNNAPGQQFGDHLPSTQREPFIARPGTQPSGSGEFRSDRQEQDPLILGTGGDAGQRIPSGGEDL